MDTKRLILFVIFSFSLMLLWDSFQKQNPEVKQSTTKDESLPQISMDLASKSDLPKTTSKFSSKHTTLKPLTADAIA